MLKRPDDDNAHPPPRGGGLGGNARPRGAARQRRADPDARKAAALSHGKAPQLVRRKGGGESGAEKAARNLPILSRSTRPPVRVRRDQQSGRRRTAGGGGSDHTRAPPRQAQRSRCELDKISILWRQPLLVRVAN